MTIRLACSVLPLALLLACSPRPDSNPPPVSLDCNVVGQACLLPFPTSVFEHVDASTPTGLLVDLPATASFAGLRDAYLRDAPDGYSAIGSMATWLPDGGTAEDLPIDYAASVHEDSAIVVVDADATSPDYGRRMPFAAELVDSAERGALLVLTPLEAFRSSGRYAVVLTDRVRAADGSTPEPDDDMRALLGLTKAPDDLVDLADYYADLVRLARVELGVRPASIVQMWDFHVRSDIGVTADLEAMATYAKAWMVDNPPTADIVDVYRAFGHDRIDFTFTVPLWREHRFDPISRDADGVPTPVGTTDLIAYVLVPDEATEDNPAIPILFGHGLGVDSDQMAPTLGGMPLGDGPFAIAALDWDLHGTRGAGLNDIIDITGSMNYPGFTGAMLQSAIDQVIATEMLMSFPAHPERGVVISSGPVLYLGQSMGSLVGVLAGTINEGLTASVLNVAGGGLTNILRHGGVVDNVGMRPGLEALVNGEPPTDFPDDLGYDVLLVTGQPGLDAGDPMSFAAHFRTDRLSDGPAHPILVQESMNDGIIPNITTEALARRMDLTLIEPAQLGAPGLERAPAPTCGVPTDGLVQFLISTQGFEAHLALEDERVQGQAFEYFTSFVDVDATNDGNIAFIGLGYETRCD